MATTHSFAVRLPLFTLVLCLLAGLLILLLGQWQTRLLAEAESDRLGKALAAQSAEIIRPYILHNDLVSLQVHVDHLVRQTEASTATIFNGQQRQLAHSGDTTTLKTYRQAVVIEGRTAATASVGLSIDTLLERYRKPLDWVLAVWAGFSLLLVAGALLTGRRLSKQLAAVTERLPGDPGAEQKGNELELLEQRLEPLLTASNEQQEPEEESALQMATMALHCKNLKKLEVQLSKEKFQNLLNKLDDDLDHLATLYEGQRRAGRDQTLFIEFGGDTETGDHPARALFCAQILLQLAEHYARAQGVAMELSAAVKLSPATAGAALLNDFEREKRELEVARLAQQSHAKQILVDSATSLHHSLSDAINSDELSESADLHQITGFTKEYQGLLDKQLRYLISNEPRATGHEQS
ncbi:hypothetical protein QSV34_08255 [Porticoccus sp. W117]|uniref:hypothetical protein n=1 Tax=Porticoccus sp. W117 TaxID=3054777 RepID=UPI002594355E|nr:hypothetical protein [Porticoccus sp. W117]MDM3871345.1 hypothetical protein [Porticoccus sp. W117]